MRMKSFFCTVLAFVLAISCVDSKTVGEWQPVGDRIMTEWAEQVDPANVLPEYPRPQLVREEWLNLNGLWNYAITEASALPEVMDGQILVPFAVESALSGVGKRVSETQALWYETEFTVPRSWKGNRIMLNFGAVDWKAEVFVNSTLAGSHTGGFTPFSMDITDLLVKGDNVLKVKVTDATDKWFQARGKQVTNPHGIWYTPVTGIWQTVWLEPVPAAHVVSYLAVSDIDKSTLDVKVDLAGVAEGDVCKVVLFDGDKAVAEAEGKNVTLNVPEMKLWSPDSPVLYDLQISVLRNGKAVDQVKGYTAMRKISVERDAAGHKRMLLNNEPLFQYGPLDQGWWPDGLYTAPTDEALLFDIVKTKEFGYNMIRKHVKVEPARWYWHCDREGMLVWQDMPSIADNSTNRWDARSYNGTDTPVTPEGKVNYYKEWSEIINANKVFPCIVVWVPFNEAWGQFDTDVSVKLTRALDPTRLINYSSGGNFVHCSGDILDLHHYPGPDMFLYEPDYVNVLGEYGGIGWPVEGHLWQTDRNWGYVQYKSADEVLATYEKYAKKLAELVEKGFAAAVYTQTTDVEGEVNGLMTYDRKVIKLDVDKLSAINRMVIESMK